MDNIDSFVAFAETLRHLRAAAKTLSRYANKRDVQEGYLDPEAHAIHAAVSSLCGFTKAALAKRVGGATPEELRAAWHAELGETRIRVSAYSAQIWQWPAARATHRRYDLCPNFVFLEESSVRDILRQIDETHAKIDAFMQRAATVRSVEIDEY